MKTLSLGKTRLHKPRHTYQLFHLIHWQYSCKGILFTSVWRFRSALSLMRSSVTSVCLLGCHDEEGGTYLWLEWQQSCAMYHNIVVHTCDTLLSCLACAEVCARYMPRNQIWKSKLLLRECLPEAMPSDWMIVLGDNPSITWHSLYY